MLQLARIRSGLGGDERLEARLLDGAEVHHVLAQTEVEGGPGVVRRGYERIAAPGEAPDVGKAAYHGRNALRVSGRRDLTAQVVRKDVSIRAACGRSRSLAAGGEGEQHGRGQQGGNEFFHALHIQGYKICGAGKTFSRPALLFAEPQQLAPPLALAATARISSLRESTSSLLSWRMNSSTLTRLDRAAEALAGLAQLAVEEDGLLDELHDLVLGVHAADVVAEALGLAPDAADDNGVAALLLGEAVHRAGLYALAAVRALLLVDNDLAGGAAGDAVHRTALDDAALDALRHLSRSCSGTLWP